MNKKSIKGKIFIYALLIILSIVFLMPLLWMITTSMMSDNVLYTFPPQFIPKKIDFSNFSLAINAMPFWRPFMNTLYITILTIIGVTASGSIVAFGFARLKFKGKKTLFFILISTMVLPTQVTLVPLYMIYRNIGWLNTYKPLIVPAFLGTPFYIFLLTQFFKTIPKELDEAAYIDGCSTFRVYWNILLPLIKPALVTVVIFCFLWTWNDFLLPLIFIDDTKKMTLSLALYAFKGNDHYGARWNLLMSASTLMMLPCLAIFAFFQKYFIEGTVISGIKG